LFINTTPKEVKSQMKIFLVGGAVRDLKMGNASKDLDYVVVGSSADEMTALGFESVGADFPVFLHPETKDEYALVRSEKSTGNGYHDFEATFDTTHTLNDGREVNTIDFGTVQRFVDAGFDPNEEYDVEELLDFVNTR
jgi:tRNA nucleotidyltransferase (CCA-adding enzyme)